MKKKICIISHALVQEASRKRWRLLAEQYDYEVHLLIPRYWESQWFGKKQTFSPQEEHSGNFHIHLMRTTSVKNWTRYFFVSFDAKFRKIKPDLIYIIHEETCWIHHQIYLYRKLWCPAAKIIFFSMNARGVPQRWFFQRLMWENIKKNTEAALVHYPGCLKSLRRAEYKKPIFLQTQIGVDEDLFKFDSRTRDTIRNFLGFNNKFVIGYTGRLTQDKGVDDLINVLPISGVDWALLLVGNGYLKKEVEDWASSKGWMDRVHITGQIPLNMVPDYMNAMDCFVLASKTTSHWVDTFPLSTVQAQACGIPVIGSDSGAIPWQLGETAIIFSESNLAELKKAIESYALNKGLRKRMAQSGRNRAIDFFCAQGITNNFDKITKQILSQKYKYRNENDPYIQSKCY